MLEYLSVILFYCYNLNIQKSGVFLATWVKHTANPKRENVNGRNVWFLTCFALMNSILFISHIDSEYLVSPCSKKVPWHGSKSE